MPAQLLKRLAMLRRDGDVAVSVEALEMGPGVGRVSAP